MSTCLTIRRRGQSKRRLILVMHLYNDVSQVPISPWANAQGAHDLVAALDEKISDSVTGVKQLNTDYDDSQLNFVDVDASGSPFAGHEVCGTDSTSWFQNVDQPVGYLAYVFHLNILGDHGY